MNNLMRTLTLSAAALAALVAAPKASADEFRHGGARETRSFRGENFRGRESRGGEFRGGQFRGCESRGREFRGGEFRGREFRGRAFFRPPAFAFGHRSVAPFRVFAGSRFFSYCPGPEFVYIDDLGWVLPPFAGALWVPDFDRFGIRIGGFWR